MRELKEAKTKLGRCKTGSSLVPERRAEVDRIEAIINEGMSGEARSVRVEATGADSNQRIRRIENQVNELHGLMVKGEVTGDATTVAVQASMMLTSARQLAKQSKATIAEEKVAANAVAKLKAAEEKAAAKAEAKTKAAAARKAAKEAAKAAAEAEKIRKIIRNR